MGADYTLRLLTDTGAAKGEGHRTRGTERSADRLHRRRVWNRKGQDKVSSSISERYRNTDGVVWDVGTLPFTVALNNSGFILIDPI